MTSLSEYTGSPSFSGLVPLSLLVTSQSGFWAQRGAYKLFPQMPGLEGERQLETLAQIDGQVWVGGWDSGEGPRTKNTYLGWD